MQHVFFLLIFFVPILLGAQPKKILFIGNSYTGANNLPQLTHDVAQSVGDTLQFDAHTPGGARLLTHASSSTALAKIKSNNWNYVVLQAQSQEPSWPQSQVDEEVFPYAKVLCDSIRANDVCSRPMFYMTWGRKNGDQNNCPSWPPVCTYEGMDSLLHARYQTMGDHNEAYVSPVGAVWKYLRTNHPTIELYAADGSHPSSAGSYAAAVTFYTMIFQKDPTFIKYDFTVPAVDTEVIKEAAKIVVFNDLTEWNVGAYDPVAIFTTTQNGASVNFMNNSVNADTYFWDFGDGNFSTDKNPIYTYTSSGIYTVSMTATSCGITNVVTSSISIQFTSNNSNIFASELEIFPNPIENLLTINHLPVHSHYQLLDVSGKICLEGKCSGTLQEINLSSLTGGIYMLNLFSKEGLFFVTKIVKN